MAWVMRKTAVCDVCGHEWLPEGYPRRCAKCKSGKWNQATKEVPIDPEPGIPVVAGEHRAEETSAVLKCGKHGKVMKDYGNAWFCEGPPPHKEFK